MKILIHNDAVILGILFLILTFVFRTANSPNPRYQGFYRYVPPILLCYFIPSILNITWFEGSEHAFKIASAEESQLYFVSSRYLLPACLVLLTLNIDFPAIRQLGPKALIMFLTGSFGILLGGPFAFLVLGLISPETVEGEVWRGLTTVAGSWIGGSANQTAMKEVFKVPDQVFSAMLAVDIVIANVWMAFILYGAGSYQKVDRWLGADSSIIDELKHRVESYQASIARVSSYTDFVSIFGIAFVCVGLSHFLADWIAPSLAALNPDLARYSLTSTFFWMVVIATSLGLGLSFTKFRTLEGAGASKLGTLLLYVLIASIGMHMDILAIFDIPLLFLLGVIWILFHVLLMFLMGYLIKAPFFFVAVGSQANVGGAASAPVVASAFHPSLAPIGVLLAVLGYAVGTYFAWLCGIILQFLAAA